MKFLSGWSIDLNKVPTYNVFKKPFIVDIDIHLFGEMYSCIKK